MSDEQCYLLHASLVLGARHVYFVVVLVIFFRCSFAPMHNVPFHNTNLNYEPFQVKLIQIHTRGCTSGDDIVRRELTLFN